MVKPERWSLRMRFVVEYLLAMRKALGFYTQRFQNKNKNPHHNHAWNQTMSPTAKKSAQT